VDGSTSKRLTRRMEVTIALGKTRAIRLWKGFSRGLPALGMAVAVDDPSVNRFLFQCEVCASTGSFVPNLHHLSDAETGTRAKARVWKGT